MDVLYNNPCATHARYGTCVCFQVRGTYRKRFTGYLCGIMCSTCTRRCKLTSPPVDFNNYDRCTIAAPTLNISAISTYRFGVYGMHRKQHCRSKACNLWQKHGTHSVNKKKNTNYYTRIYYI